MVCYAMHRWVYSKLMHPKLWGCTPVQAISKIQDQGGMVGIAEQLQFCETPKKQLLFFFSLGKL